MEQDIRELFKDTEEQNKTIPEGHKAEFLEKLKTSRKQPKNYRILYEIAAALVVFIAISYALLKPKELTNEVAEESKIEQQIKTIEVEYLASIEIEWQNFLALATDQKLIKKYEERLDNLDQDYQDISEQFKESKSDILIVEALIENLQTRLQLLKDIQEHINILNQQKNERYETTI